ncbi:Slc9a8 [Symbiodinium natans]|uniref:Slc9a8 protein n=1 Tax=Symbiodinium natans TaxID=878477 RepID=A0A812ICL4_9DINO|nr:Slc9a8 [Symbiodinium natans]
MSVVRLPLALLVLLSLHLCAGRTTNSSESEEMERFQTIQEAIKEEGTEGIVHEWTGLMVCCSASVMIALLIGNFLHVCEVSIVSESSVIILVGFLLGVILPTDGSILGWGMGTVDVETEGLLMATFLNLFLLPVIIFEAGWSMTHRDFINQLFTILTFAVLGTLISMLVVGLLIMSTCHIHGVCRARTAFTYAALISAVDPVATLATYAHLQVDPLLNIIVFGESVVNDAVAIVLFRVLNSSESFEDMSVGQVSGRIGSQTLLLLFGSVGLGIMLGFLLMLTTRYCRLADQTPSLVLFVFVSSFFIYCFAERVCGMSGIITVLIASMFASGFAKHQFSPEATMFCAFALKQAATLADMVVFLFCGITAVYCDMRGMVFGGLVIAFCLLGRAAAVLPLALLTNGLKAATGRGESWERSLRLDWKKIFMMWHAGLRGGIALVLTLELEPWVDEGTPGQRDTLRNATILIIVFFLLFFGGSTKVLLKNLGIPMEGKAKPMHIHHGKFWRFLHRIRYHVLGPMLIADSSKLNEGALPQLIADIAAVEGRQSSSASLPPGQRSSRLPVIQSQRSIDARRGDEMVSLFGMVDPLNANESGSEGLTDASSSEVCVGQLYHDGRTGKCTGAFRMLLGGRCSEDGSRSSIWQSLALAWDELPAHGDVTTCDVCTRPSSLWVRFAQDIMVMLSQLTRAVMNVVSSTNNHVKFQRAFEAMRKAYRETSRPAVQSWLENRIGLASFDRSYYYTVDTKQKMFYAAITADLEAARLAEAGFDDVRIRICNIINFFDIKTKPKAARINAAVIRLLERGDVWRAQLLLSRGVALAFKKPLSSMRVGSCIFDASSEHKLYGQAPSANSLQHRLCSVGDAAAVNPLCMMLEFLLVYLMSTGSGFGLLAASCSLEP